MAYDPTAPENKEPKPSNPNLPSPTATPDPNIPGSGTGTYIPPTPPPPTSPPTTQATNPDGSPAGSNNLSPHASWISSIFKQQGKTASANDISYWENVINRANGDLGYVQMRMLQPDGPPEGSKGPSGGGQLNYQQQLAYLATKLGHTLTAAEIQRARAQFGGTENDTTDTATLDKIASFLGGGTHTSVDYFPRTPDGTGAGNGNGSSNYNGSLGNGLIQQLIARATQSLNIDPQTDAIIRPQVDAANATMQRNRRGYLNDLAESGNPYATGSQNTAAAQTSEAVGQQTSTLQNQLTQNELTARRTEIQSALTQMGSQLTSAQQIELQRQLGLIDAALRGTSINNQNFQFYSGLGSANDQFAANYNLNATNQANYWDWVRRTGGAP